MLVFPVNFARINIKLNLFWDEKMASYCDTRCSNRQYVAAFSIGKDFFNRRQVSFFSIKRVLVCAVSDECEKAFPMGQCCIHKVHITKGAVLAPQVWNISD